MLYGAQKGPQRIPFEQHVAGTCILNPHTKARLGDLYGIYIDKDARFALVLALGQLRGPSHT